MSSQQTKRHSPYPGLIYYSEHDESFFFGRDKETRLIIANLFASPLTLLYGTSGVGKSSVLRAGVAARLRKRSDLLVVVFNSWQGNPTRDLIQAILEQARLVNTEATARLVEYSSAKLTLAGTIELVSIHLGRRLMIILDQFEEYFLYHPIDDEFASQFSTAVTNPNTPTGFLISVREDFYAKLDRFEGRIPMLYENYLRIDHLNTMGGKDAIEKPIDQFNQEQPGKGDFSVEQELVTALLEQIETGQVVLGDTGRGAIETSDGTDRERQIETPFLQLVVTRLWDAELAVGSHNMRLETLNRLGGAENVVKTHLDEILGTLSPQERTFAAGIFHYLITPSGTKIAYTVPDLAGSTGLDESELTRVLEKLAYGDVRIIRPVDPAPERPDFPRYEIFHDVMVPAILTWRAAYVQMAARADAERRAEQQKRRADEQARVAARLRRLVAGLVIVTLFALAALGWASIQTVQAGRYLRQSENLKTQAAELSAKSEDDRKLAQSAAESAAIYKSQGERALRETEVAKQKTNEQIAISTRRKAEADEARRAATIAGLKVEKEAQATRVASANLLSSEAQRAMNESPQLSVLLTVEALRTTQASDPPTPAVENTLRLGLGRLGGNPIAGSTTEEERYPSVAFSSDRRWLAKASSSQFLLWKLTGGQVVDMPTILPQAAAPLAFSSDNRWLISSIPHASGKPQTTKGMLYLWDLTVTTPEAQPILIMGGGAAADGILITPDNCWLIAGSVGASTMYVVDLKDKLHETTAISIPHLGVGQSRINFDVSPDSHWLAVSTHGALRVWNLAAEKLSAKPIELLAGWQALPSIVTFSNNSRWLVSAGEGPMLTVKEKERWGALFGTSPERSMQPQVQLWDLSKDQIAADPIVLTDQRDLVSVVAFSDDSEWLAVGSGNEDDGTIRIWDLTGKNVGAAPPLLLSGNDGAPFSISFVVHDRFLLVASCCQDTTVFDSQIKVLGARNPNFMFGNSTIRMWDLGNLRQLKSGNAIKSTKLPILVDTNSPTGAVALTEDKRYLVSVNRGNSMVWDLNDVSENTFPQARVLSGHDSLIRSLAFSSDSRWLVTTEADGPMRLWDLKLRTNATQPLNLPLKAPINLITQDANYAVSQDLNNFFKLGLRNSVRLSPTGRWIAELTDGQTPALREPAAALNTKRTNTGIKLWDLNNHGSASTPFLHHSTDINNLTFSRDDKWLATSTTDNSVHLWSLTTSEQSKSRTFRGSEAIIDDLKISPDNKWLIAASRDGKTFLWNIETDATAPEPFLIKSQIAGDPSAKNYVIVSANSRWLMTGSSTRIFDLASPNPAANPVMLRGIVPMDCKFSSDGRWLVMKYVKEQYSYGGDWYQYARDLHLPQQGILLIDLLIKDSVKRRFLLASDYSSLHELLFSPDSHWLFSLYPGSTIRRWDLTASDPSLTAYTLGPRPKPVYSLLVTPDSRWLIGKGSPSVMWDLKSSDLTASEQILPYSSTISDSLVLDSSGRWLAVQESAPIKHPNFVSSGNVQPIQHRSWLVDLTAPNPISTARMLGGSWGSMIGFTNDRRWMVSSTPDGIMLTALETKTLADLACQRVGRNLTQEEWDRYFPGQPYRLTCPQLASKLLPPSHPDRMRD